jgi:hypothetical protein
MRNVIRDFLQFLRIEIIVTKLVFDLWNGKFGKLPHLLKTFIGIDFNSGKVPTTRAGNGHAAQCRVRLCWSDH